MTTLKLKYTSIRDNKETKTSHELVKDIFNVKN